MRVLIAGCGYVGTVLGRLLANMGHTAFGMKRNPACLPPGIDRISADLLNPESLKKLPDDLDAVVFCASAGGFSEDRYREVYVDGTRNLLGALEGKTKNSCRTLFVSSTGVYGQLDGGWVDEHSQTTPTNFSGKVMLEGETVVKEDCSRPIILRFGGIYGPGRDRLIRLVKEGNAKVGKVPRYTNRIYREDGAAAIIHLLNAEDTQTIYNVVDKYPATDAEVVEWIAGRLGVVLSPESSTIDESATRGGNKRVSSKRLLASGFRFQYPDFRSGYNEILREIERKKGDEII